jgi:hypothetical protein
LAARDLGVRVRRLRRLPGGDPCQRILCLAVPPVGQIETIPAPGGSTVRGEGVVVKRPAVASLFVLGLLASAWLGLAHAGSAGKPTTAERAAIIQAARPYIARNSVKGLTYTTTAVVLSSPRGFAAISIESTAGGVVVLLRKLANGAWWPVDLGSEFSCSEATAKLFASMHLTCLPSGSGAPSDAPILPTTVRGSRACGRVASRYNPDHFRVYVTFGTLSCADARRIVP